MIPSAASKPPARQNATPRDEPDGLVERAREEMETQVAALEATPLESQYAAAFAAQVEAKHGQAERIEDRLENLVEQQSSRLQQTRSQQPGLLSGRQAREQWQRKVQHQQSTVQRLQSRLEIVREIRESMGVHSPRIEELAARKLRAQEPELAEAWLDMQEARRRHEELTRREEQAKRRSQGAKRSAHSLSLTQQP